MTTGPDQAAGTDEETQERSSLLSSSAVMAAGTVVSRMSGFVRNALLAAAIGFELHADVFNIANTVPNMLYILLAGGVFNAVLVPQLVRAMKQDPDGGDAYAHRIVTLAGMFLAGVTAVLVLAAPLLMRLFLDPAFFTTPELAPQRESAIAFARYCLPQVFFYGMFVLLGQVLNARRVFGPMMWVSSSPTFFISRAITSAACFCRSISPLYATVGRLKMFWAWSVALYRCQSFLSYHVGSTFSFWNTLRNSGVSLNPAPGAAAAHSVG